MLWSHRARSSIWTELNRAAQARSFKVLSRLSSYAYAYRTAFLSLPPSQKLFQVRPAILTRQELQLQGTPAQSKMPRLRDLPTVLMLMIHSVGNLLQMRIDGGRRHYYSHLSLTQCSTVKRLRCMGSPTQLLTSKKTPRGINLSLFTPRSRRPQIQYLRVIWRKGHDP